MSSSSGRRNDGGSEGEVEEETTDAKIERLATEMEELKATLIGVPELSDEWFRIKTDIKDRDTERLLLIEKKRCDGVVKEYFEKNPHVLEAAPECPICLEKMWTTSCGAVRYVCCGKQVCKTCNSEGGDVLDTCPLCRGEAPESDVETRAITKEKADSGIAWAQADFGAKTLFGLDGVPKDVEKGKSLLSEAAEKGSTRAKEILGSHYYDIENYVEARRWNEAAAAEGEMLSLFRLGMMMEDGQAFDKSEQTQAEAFRVVTISATLLGGPCNLATVELSNFFHDSLPVMLHYLRPAVEEGSTSETVVDNYALGLIKMAIECYGKRAIFAPGHSPVPEVMFWYRQYDRKEEPDANHFLVPLERKIREQCAQCEADLPEGKQSCCVECKAAYYCSRDCQFAHWKAGHKKDCVKRLKKRLRAEGKLDEEK